MRILKDVTALTAAFALSLASVPAIFADDVPEWPSEQEQRLNEVDSLLFDLHGERFRAWLAKDQEGVRRLERRVKKVQEERNRLLQATGRR